jgi:hypothetical protein
MTSVTAVRGSIPAIIRNEENLYEGDLVGYLRIVFHNGRNVLHPYHNFRHTCHVLYQCHDAIRYYKGVLSGEKGRLKARHLLIAALFHDFDHLQATKDHLNIENSVKGLTIYLRGDDRDYFRRIETLVRFTEYPHRTELDRWLMGLIIRDADLTQALEPAWIQQVVLGLAAERRINPITVLEQQVEFLSNLRFETSWAREKFPQSLIDSKLEETVDLLTIL